jgi:hypothetical protein
MDATQLDLADFDLQPIWHSLGSGAAIAAAVTLVRLGLEFAIRHNERRLEHEDRRRAHQRDAEARLERLLQDRLSEADRRLERCELDMDTERERRFAIERDYAVLRRAYELLEERCRPGHMPRRQPPQPQPQPQRQPQPALLSPTLVIDPSPLGPGQTKPPDTVTPDAAAPAPAPQA